MSLPDFLIIGAMKCGTTTLQSQLARQPGLFMTTPKEPNFFSDDTVYAQGMAWYQGRFQDAAQGDLIGEASTHYTKLPSYPHTLARMSEVLEAPKLIYMIRNPLERGVSHYIHCWSKKTILEPIDQAFEQHSNLTDFGRYGMQIAPFVAQYGRDAILLTSLERLTTAPQDELSRIGAFLETPSPLQWQQDLGAQNVSAQRVRPLPMQRLLVDNPVAETLRRAFVPKALRTWVRSARTISVRPSLGADRRTQLEDLYAADRQELAAFFPDHPALRDCYPFLS